MSSRRLDLSMSSLKVRAEGTCKVVYINFVRGVHINQFKLYGIYA